MDIKQDQVIKAIRSALGIVPSIRNLTIDDEQNATQLNVDIGSASVSITSNSAFTRLRCDVNVHGNDDDDVIIAGTKICDLIKDYNLASSHVVDGEHITVMTLISYEDLEDLDESNAKDEITQKSIAFCNAIRTACTTILGENLENDFIDSGADSAVQNEISVPVSDNETRKDSQDEIIEAISSSIPDLIAKRNNVQSTSSLDDILLKLAESETALENSQNVSEDKEMSQDTTESKNRKRKRKRNRHRNTQKEEEPSEIISIEDQENQKNEPDNSEIIEKPKSLSFAMKDALAPESYEMYPELSSLRDRLYKQVQHYMEQAETRTKSREKKLDDYKAELDKAAEGLTLSQQAFNEEVSNARKSLNDIVNIG